MLVRVGDAIERTQSPSRICYIMDWRAVVLTCTRDVYASFFKAVEETLLIYMSFLGFEVKVAGVTRYSCSEWDAFSNLEIVASPNITCQI